ncbi:MAG TPA: PDZ domain-containing protein [Gemmatimonadota bacterium]|nr:PDZ domain-containing protein [Gemmatimonadota bacterium]
MRALKVLLAAVVAAVAGLGHLAFPAALRAQSDAAVPVVHFRAGGEELLEIAYPGGGRAGGESVEEDIAWVREEAEPLVDWWDRQGSLFLQRVADFTGLDWPYRDIEVYLVRDWPTVSIEYPLVLALGSVRGTGGEVPIPDDLDLRLLIVAHQLTHYLLDAPPFVAPDRRDPAYDHPFMAPGNFDAEALVNWVTYRALEDLWGRRRLAEAFDDPLWRAYNPNHAFVVEALEPNHRLSRIATLADWLDRNPPGSAVFAVREEYAERAGAEAPAPVARERASGTDYGLDLGATYDTRIFVAYVDAGSPAARAGVLQGDLLRTIEGRPVGSDVVDAQRRMTEAWERDDEINLSVERSGAEVFVLIESR